MKDSMTGRVLRVSLVHWPWLRVVVGAPRTPEPTHATLRSYGGRSTTQTPRAHDCLECGTQHSSAPRVPHGLCGLAPLRRALILATEVSLRHRKGYEMMNPNLNPVATTRGRKLLMKTLLVLKFVKLPKALTSQSVSVLIVLRFPVMTWYND